MTLILENLRIFSNSFLAHSLKLRFGQSLLIKRCEHRSAAIVVIGDEVLKGQVQDTNSKFLAKRLYENGYRVKKIIVLGDNVREISETYKTFAKTYDIVLSSGGIGPTHDDDTFEALAEAFDDELHYHPNLVEMCRQFFKIPDNEANHPGLKLARIPKLAKLTYGVDPQSGQKSLYPNISIGNVFIFPGVPSLCEKMFGMIQLSLFPKVGQFFNSCIYLTCTENEITNTLNQTVETFPLVSFGSYPVFTHSYYKVKITLESSFKFDVDSAKRYLIKNINCEHILNYDQNCYSNIAEKLQRIDSKILHETLKTLKIVLDKYDSKDIFIYFDGGKNSTLLLHLLACIYEGTGNKLNVLHVLRKNKEVTSFVETTVKSYNNCNMLCFESHNFERFIKSDRNILLLKDGVNLWDESLSTAVKLNIEKHWRDRLKERPFDENSEKQKFYVLSMFPYPSGQLHMGHVRVYSIADAIARFHRLRGQNVVQPMGWDAFGLPAENAARDRGLDPDRWTQSNIATMKEAMEQLNFSFDWDREFATCDSDYYRWTQFLFLKLLENDLVYQKEALVNWDPVDETVLAEEQVDNNGRSWRSGAKVEKKKLNQWFIRTTRFSKDLYNGLDDPELRDWRDIVKVQKHWIGICNGFTFDLDMVVDGQVGDKLTVWTDTPEYIDRAEFVAIKPNSIWNTGKEVQVKNPFTLDVMPVLVTEKVEFPEGCDTYLGIPDIRESDAEFMKSVGITKSTTVKPLMTDEELKVYRKKICAEAKRRGIGGWPTSSKLRDWLISRQRYWGTPIPIIHCEKCGVQAVPEQDLPVKLPAVKKIVVGKNPLMEATKWFHTSCPKCGGSATRETDTMDTFVDSSWYYLRFLDPDNLDIPFSPKKSMKFMPVDVYVGGKEHAVLHLYYSRFFCHFLYSAGLVPRKEPFKRLLVQGLVKGKTFKSKKTGEYFKSDIVTEEKKTAYHKETKEPLSVIWEKMSKSKFNGVDPDEMFKEFGCDTTKLIILADVAPTSDRNWSRDTFPGILKWQHRLWLTLQNFIKIRKQNLEATDKSEGFHTQEEFLWDSRNYYIKGVTFNFLESYQLSVAISKMQGLTNSIRKSSKDVIGLCKEYERALAAQIIMLSPVAPHFASELWAGFVSAPNRLSLDILWDKPVNCQPWPKIDYGYSLTLAVTANGKDLAEIKISKSEFDQLSHADALRLAHKDPAVVAAVSGGKIVKSKFILYKDCSAKLSFSVRSLVSNKQTSSEDEDDQVIESKVL